MKKVKKIFKKVVIGSIAQDILILAFAILLLAKTDLTETFVITIAGLLLLIDGALSIIRFLFKGLKSSVFRIDVVTGIIYIMIGAIAIVKPDLITNFIMVVIGLSLIINGLKKAFYTYKFHTIKDEIWPLLTCITIGILAMGVILIINPFSSAILLTRVIGLFLLCYSIFDVMQWTLFNKRLESLLKIFK